MYHNINNPKRRPAYSPDSNSQMCMGHMSSLDTKSAPCDNKYCMGRAIQNGLLQPSINHFCLRNSNTGNESLGEKE